MAHQALDVKPPSDPKLRTICWVHRNMYQIIKNLPDGLDKEQLFNYLAEAFNYGIRMSNKLTEYSGQKPSKWQPKVFKREDVDE